ncbi:PREDICTED: Hermansky-Pudlak syndrome 6 protein [Cyprinodon variegatus]|uniref:Hermansky-Pudlak syndrome 6 protein n=1 Tax=Cyprinodon variegatus TaxID=28743 RepID=UPI0007424F76|nr:PREDICTED: Hermansky-Pudlak syndrome 6 protein [Cyprinodon variegatus]
MSRFVLEEFSDFGDFSGNQKLSELLSFSNDERSRSRLSDVRVSPDGRHIHVLLRQPKVGLMTFDRQERPQLALNPKKLDVWLKGGHPIVDVFYLDLNRAKGAGAVAVVVYENGKAEFWKFLECKTGWHLLQTSDLCNSPRARVVSVSACSSILVWCEERPASESSPVLSSSRNKLRYCVCRRDWEVEDGAVSLGGLKIILHNNPKYTVISSGDYVHLLPYLKIKSQLCVSKFFLTWSPHHDSFTINTLCKNTPIKKLSAKESDFRRLVTDSLGYLSDVEPPEICSFSPTGCGGLLLLLSTGWLYLLQKDGIMRQVYKLAENFMLQDSHISLCMYADTVALIAGKTLHLLELNCGRELQKVALKREGLLYSNQTERGIPHLLSDTGLFMLVEKDPTGKPLGSGPVEGVHPGALLVEAVFEEACKYYQQRSLSSTQLTVDILKKGGRFQAPISLASVLRNYLNSGLRRNDTEAIQNGADEYIAAHEKLMCSLEGELRALVSLEELKGSLVRGSVKEVEAVCESLVEKEVVRLLSSPELNREALLYLNSIFSIFPSQAWRAAQAALQLHYNGDGSLSSKASTDVWKTVLSPCPNSFLFANGQSKHSHSLRGDFNCKVKPAAPTSPAALPVFELLCQSVFHFQPSWLPRFLELSQQQQGSAVLGLSLVSSSWGLSSGRGGEGGENNVPLYKRALWVLSNLNPDGDQRQELEVELLLVSGRPNAILQALRILMGKRQWERVTQVAQQFCKQSPLLNKEIFTSLLCEVAQHRELDPYLELLWALCPEDFTVTTILNLVLKNLPSSCSASPHTPFADTHSSQLTIGHLKPLLRKVLQRETKPSQRYADILQSPSYPPPALPRQPAEQASSIFNGNVDSAPSLHAETDEQTPPANTNTQRCDAVLAAAPLGFT